jgi:hypothetical protein
VAADFSEEVLLFGDFVFEVAEALVFGLLDDVVVCEESVVVVVDLWGGFVTHGIIKFYKGIQHQVYARIMRSWFD